MCKILRVKITFSKPMYVDLWNTCLQIFSWLCLSMKSFCFILPLQIWPRLLNEFVFSMNYFSKNKNYETS